jgi:hypothetical protein
MQPTLHLASGNLTAHALGRLLVVTDHEGRLLAVGVYRRRRRQGPGRQHRPEITFSTVYDRSPTMILRARWTGPAPKIGEYLMSQHRARRAYQIVEVSAPSHVGWDTEARKEVRQLRFEVLRVDLPLPPAAVVHPWKWDSRGKNTGVRP